ncbi:MAG TPA: YqgE/AlgH family protein [Paracoccaceae bacterium]|nr:YqgE/AlgH family protein [Paracoccaceae bacterium]
MADDISFLDGKVLIAMPGMQDPRFARAIVYLCAHSTEGAMGLIVNKRAEDLVWRDLFKRLGIPIGSVNAPRPVHYGGPVETGRGFVLHSGDYHAEEATMKVDGAVSMTATLDVLQAMALGRGPDRAIVALGYTGWAPGQLESELQMNGWLLCDPDEELLFGDEDERKWDRALRKLGVDPSLLGPGGHA